MNSYKAQLEDCGSKELIESKKIIRDAFSLDYDFTGPRLREARKAVNDFIKLSNYNVSYIADIMLYYVEMGVKFTNDYGDIDEPFYESVERMYEKATKYTCENKLQDKFIERFIKIVEDTEGIGWGFYDNLKEIFIEFFLNVPIRDPKW